jgi:alpha-L-arabinofuranosidase
MSVSAGMGCRRRHRFAARGFIIGWLILVGLLAAAGGVSNESGSEPMPEDTMSEQPPLDSVGAVRVRGRLNLGQDPATINPFIYGQSLETLGRGFEGGLWAELLEDRKFFRPPTAPGSPWKRLGSQIGWSLTYDIERPHAGVGSVKVTVTDRAQDIVHGIEQGDLPLSAGQEYVGHVILAGRGLVNIFLEWGDQVGARDVIRIRLSQEGFGRYPLRFLPRANTTKGRLSIGLESTGSIWIGAVSLMPANHREGLRSDTVALLGQLNTPIYRWPGGCALAGYDWRDGIGPRDQRPPRLHPSWGEAVEPNDFGIGEFVELCRVLGAEPLVVVDTGIGSPELAAALVQYCNGSDRTIWGRRRALNGHAEPYAVRWWALGNGLPGDGQAGDMPLDQRLARHSEFVRAMRAMDDRIQLVGVSQRGPWNEAMVAENRTVEVMSERIAVPCGSNMKPDVDSSLITLRGIVKEYRPRVGDGPALSAVPISIGLDGWNRAATDALNGANDLSEAWRDALKAASGLHEMARHPDLVRMAHFAPQQAEVIGTIRATRTNAVVTPAAGPLGLYRQQFGSEGLRIEGELEPLDVVAALSADRRQVTIGILNTTHRDAQLELELAGGSTDVHAIRHQMGLARPLFNSPDLQPDPVIQETMIDNFDPARIDVAPWSLTLFLVPLRR